MKKIFLSVLSIIFCCAIWAQQSKMNPSLVSGTWKINAILNEGGFYYNFEKDTVVIISKAILKSVELGGKEGIAFITQTKNDFAELKDQVYQFNNDSSFSISNQKKKPKEEQRGFYRIDKNNAVITMKVIDSDPKNSFEISETIVETKSDKLVLRLEQNGTKLTFEFGRIK